MFSQKNPSLIQKKGYSTKEKPPTGASRTSCKRIGKASNQKSIPNPQPAKPRFIRKHNSKSRCQTPDQSVGTAESTPQKLPSHSNKPISNKTSRLLSQNQNSPFFKPRDIENQSYLESSPCEIENSICMPYELKEKIHNSKKVTELKKATINQNSNLRKNNSSDNLISNVNNFSPEQNSNSSKSSRENNVPQKINNSPANKPTKAPSLLKASGRESKLNQLSKKFRLDKKSLVSQIKNASRRSCTEYDFEDKENMKFGMYTYKSKNSSSWDKFVNALESINSGYNIYS